MSVLLSLLLPPLPPLLSSSPYIPKHIPKQKWLNFAIYIGTIATTLLNFVDPEDTTGLISAGLFTFAALAAIAYSAIIFVYRAYSIRSRRAEGMYYDKYGPTILSLMLLGALGTNIALRLKEMVNGA